MVDACDSLSSPRCRTAVSVAYLVKMGQRGAHSLGGSRGVPAADDAGTLVGRPSIMEHVPTIISSRNTTAPAFRGVCASLAHFTR